MASVNSELFQIPGFKFVQKNRIAGEGGGVAIYWSDDLKWNRRTDLETDKIECIWMEVDIFESKTFLVGCIDRPPTLLATCEKTLTKILTKCKLCHGNISPRGYQRKLPCDVVSHRSQRIIHYSWIPATG